MKVEFDPFKNRRNVRYIAFIAILFKIQAKKVSPLYSPLLLPMYRPSLTVILVTV